MAGPGLDLVEDGGFSEPIVVGRCVRLSRDVHHGGSLPPGLRHLVPPGPHRLAPPRRLAPPPRRADPVRHAAGRPCPIAAREVVA